MAERKKESFSPPALGGSSLLVVFAVLALTVFALLSLSTVRADVRLGDTALQAVTGYYAADCKAQEILARIRNGEVPEDVTVNTSVDYPDRAVYLYAYDVPISENRTLEVEVEASPDGTEFTILRWEAIYTGDWVFDDNLYVWDGEF